MHSKLPSFGDYTDFLRRKKWKKKKRKNGNGKKEKKKKGTESYYALITQPDLELVGDTSASASRVLGLKPAPSSCCLPGVSGNSRVDMNSALSRAMLLTSSGFLLRSDIRG